MKHTWILALTLCAACSPQVYPLYLDVRQPSASGLSLAGKNISVVYMDGTTRVDSLFDRQVASSLARKLEEDYFGGSEQVGLFRIPQADSVSVDLMHSLVMETEGDVVFVLSSKLGVPEPENNQAVSNATSPDSAYVCPVAVPVKTQLYVYDSMGEDKVLPYAGSAVLRARVYNNGMVTSDGLRTLSLYSLSPEAEHVGQNISRRFLSQWNTESFSFYYYDSDNWIDGIVKIYEGKMAEAVDIWAPLVKKGNAQSRACACYNMAQTFYLLGDYALSTRWLDEAEKLENVSLAAGLRKRLSAHL